MDETRLRAVIREEIALAVQTLADQMYDSDPESTGVSFEQAASYFTTYAYQGACEAADAERATAAENPFEESPEAERRRVAHAAAYLPAIDLNALDPGAYKLLGNLARNDAYTNAVIRLVQHGGPRIGQ